MSLAYNTYAKDLTDVLKKFAGAYVTAYQVCAELKRSKPDVWEALKAAYPMGAGKPPMGKGAGKYNSPASYASKAFEYLTDKHPQICKERFDTEHTELGGVEPGATEIAIWAWR